MVREIRIQNYKSILDLTLELGRVNVFIGANGSGKSNILEAVVCAGASGWPLQLELLELRGVRVTDPEFMLSRFPESRSDPCEISVSAGDLATPVVVSLPFGDVDGLVADGGSERASPSLAWPLRDAGLFGFLNYTPENSALRIFQTPTQTRPLGVRGEGLFSHLKDLSRTDAGAAVLEEIGEHLALIDWFDRLEIPRDLAPGERSIRVRDRYLAEGALFDQRSANEGFLYLLFYFTLLLSPHTPRFFAIDNVDASLNPKLCLKMMREFIALTAAKGKQVILTTHNPALLDGLDLSDPEQRLFVIDRGPDGETRAHRVAAPRPLDGDAPVPLSLAFTRGYLGGLPESF